MDASAYEQGARKIADSNKAAGASATALDASIVHVSNTVTAAAGKISQAGDAAEKLRRQFIPGAAEAAKLENAVRQLNAQLSIGKLTAAEHSAAMDGAIRRYGTEASATVLAARNQTELALAVEQTTQKYAQQANVVRAANQNIVASQRGMIDSASQFRRQNLGMQLFDVGQSAALGMNPAMILAQQGPQVAQIYAMQGGVKALLTDLAGIARMVGPAVVAVGGLYAAYKMLSAYSAEARLAVDGMTQALAAQASPISSLEGKISELEKIQSAYSDAILATASTQDAATKSILANSEAEFNAKKSLLELELKRQEAAMKLQESLIAIEGLHLKQDIGSQMGPTPSTVAGGYSDPKINGGIPFVRVPDSVSGMEKLTEIIASSPATDKIKEMEANSVLAQGAVDKLREALKMTFQAGSDLLNQANGTGPGSSSYSKAKAYTDAMLKVQQYYHSIYNPPNVSMERVPTPAERPQNFFPPIDQEQDKAAAKTESAYQQLMRTASQRIAQAQNEIAIAGESADAQARLRLEFEMMSQAQEAAARNGKQLGDQELAAIKAKADALAALNQQLAMQKLSESQADQVKQLQLEAQLIGASASERARATAALQAEQQLRQQGINLLSQEAQQYVANAQAIAQARLEIERQNAAFASLQQAGGSAIDSLTTGTGSLKDRLKSAADTMLQWIQQLAIANPLKNALFGSNLPTLGDLFSGKPAVPGATSTAMMTVTAGTVMVNGGMGGFPMAPTSGSLSGLLGLPTPANSNIANGVRPTLTTNGLVNSPVPMLPTGTTPANMIAYQQAISSVESGSLAGNYGALGPWTKSGDRAYGRYQVMGDNVGPWTEKYYGQKLTPDQFVANPKAQDAVFNGEFGSYVNQYGPSGAAAKWFTGSPTIRGRSDVLGTTDNQYVDKFNAALRQASTQTTATTKDLSGLGDTSSKLGTQLTDSLGKLTAPATTPQPVVPTATPTATSGGGIFSMLFGWIPKLFGFADGTDYSPGGPVWVGERGPEIVNLPRGSQVVPNHKSSQRESGAQPVILRREYTINVSGNGDSELMERMKLAAEQTVRDGIVAYDRALPDRIEAYGKDPYNRG